MAMWFGWLRGNDQDPIVYIVLSFGDIDFLPQIAFNEKLMHLICQEIKREVFGFTAIELCDVSDRDIAIRFTVSWEKRRVNECLVTEVNQRERIFHFLYPVQ